MNNTVKRIKRQMTDLGKIFAKVMSYKKFGFIEYEKFSKVKNKKTERKIFGKTNLIIISIQNLSDLLIGMRSIPPLWRDHL